jgi:hypothetical protein
MRHHNQEYTKTLGNHSRIGTKFTGGVINVNASRSVAITTYPLLRELY